MSESKKISRLVVAATQSGCGKTTLTCGILAALKKRGLAAQAYKIGPDYIDPGYLAQASGRAAWMAQALPSKKRQFPVLGSGVRRKAGRQLSGAI